MIHRRDFLRGLTIAGAAATLGVRPPRAIAEAPPETAKLRLIRSETICWAPQYVAEELLRAEGFTEVTYVEMPIGLAVSKFLAGGQADISMNFVGPNIIRIDQGDPSVFLAGVHVGCFERRFTPRYDYAVQVMKELPYGKWREYDPEDTLRFYALRLHEAGMIKSSPQKLIAQGTDWRFLNELKKELKG